MEKSEIDIYLTAQFWDSPSIATISSATLNVCEEHLPAGTVLFQTSGSSGTRKWVIHTRESLLESASLVVNHLAISSNDKWFLALPIHHVGGFGILARSYISGCSIVTNNKKWLAKDALSVIAREDVSICSFVPAQVVDIVNAGLRCPDSVRAVIVGGGSLDVVIKLKATSLGWPILESYGMTETGSQIATQLSSEEDELLLINGWDVRTDLNGLLEVKGKGLMKGYLISSKDQLEIIKPFDEDDWFKTSDRVEISTDSKSIKFLSRSDRTVKILGELVDLDRLEFDLNIMTKVEIFIVELYDKRRGYSLCPVIEISSMKQLDLELLNLSGLCRLESITVCDSFPRNAMGKLDRTSLRELVVLSE